MPNNKKYNRKKNKRKQPQQASSAITPVGALQNTTVSQAGPVKAAASKVLVDDGGEEKDDAPSARHLPNIPAVEGNLASEALSDLPSEAPISVKIWAAQALAQLQKNQQEKREAAAKQKPRSIKSEEEVRADIYAEMHTEVGLLEEIKNGNLENTISRLLEFEATTQNPVARCGLGLLYLTRGKEGDEIEGIRFLRLATEEQNYSDAQFVLGDYYLTQAPIRDTQQGLKLMKSASEKGCAKASYWLCVFYEKNGNMQEAAAFEALAAAQGNLDACYGLGERLENSGSMDVATQCYEAAAEQGHAQAQLHLYVLYREGKKVSKNVGKAFSFLTQAAEQGSSIAQYVLGKCYNHGEGMPRNMKEAVRWFTLAAEQNDTNAQFELGRSYQQGQGVQKDLSQALSWLERAVEGGHVEAQFHLGAAYCFEKGRHENIPRGIELIQAAANQGVKEAIAFLPMARLLTRGKQNTREQLAAQSQAAIQLALESAPATYRTKSKADKEIFESFVGKVGDADAKARLDKLIQAERVAFAVTKKRFPGHFGNVPVSLSVRSKSAHDEVAAERFAMGIKSAC